MAEYQIIVMPDGEEVEFPVNMADTDIVSFINKSKTPSTKQGRGAGKYAYIPEWEVPKWGAENPRLYGVAGAARETLGPLAEWGGLTAGSIMGAASPMGPAGSVPGAMLGYGAGRMATGQADVMLGNRPDPGMFGAAKEGLQEAATGGILEMGGKILAPAVADVAKHTILPLANKTVLPLARGVKNVIDPWLPGGVDRVAQRTLLEAAGKDKNNIIKLLRQNQQLPGGRAGAGEVAAPAGRAEFSALQRYAKEAEPTGFHRMAQAENQARIGMLRDISPGNLSAMKVGRDKVANNLYNKAWDDVVKADPKLLSMTSNPFFKTAMKDANTLAQANNITPKNNLVQYLHYVKLSLDKQLTKTGETALSNTEKGAVRSIKKRLTDWLSKKSPNYEAARATYAEASRPINQREIGQYLEQKLVPALSESAKQRSTAYAQALQDAPGTLKRATGFRGNTQLNQMLTPQQVGQTEMVKQNLERAAMYDQLVQAGRSKAGGILGAQAP